MTFTLSRAALPLAALVTLSACAVEPTPPQLQMALQSPAKAADCRMVYRESAKASGGTATPVPGGLAGIVAVAVATGIANGIAEERRTRDLIACYDRVDAPANERLPVRGPGAASEAEDMAAIMGSGASPTRNVMPAGHPDRRGPNGGAGFSTF